MNMMADKPNGSQPISLDHITKRFGEFYAVKNLSLDVAAGEFVTLLGPSGCGKTTTLKIIAGLTPQDGGEIRFGPRRVDMLPANKRNVGLVFQNYALFPHMTVNENIAFGLRMRGWRRSAQVPRVAELLSLVRLEGLGDRRPAQLSGGQQQRVAVARALAFGPDLVLLDEPLSNLDAKLRDEVRLDLRDIQRRAKQTTIFVTHDQVEALVMSDRIILMNQGVIEQVASPRELYAVPATEFAARFVGANNLIPGVLVSAGTEFAATTPGFDAPVLAATAAPHVTTKGQPVWICIRPEQLTLDRNGGTDACALTVTVTDVVFQGTSILVDLERPGLGHLRSERPPEEAAGLRPGDKMNLRILGCHLVPRNNVQSQAAG